MDSLKSFFKRRSWPSTRSPSSSPSKIQLHRDSKPPSNFFVMDGLGVGAIEYNDGSCGNLEVSSASPASCNSHFGYAVCVFPDERARIADAPTNPTAKPSSGVAQQQPSSAPGAFPQSVPSEKRRAEGISLNCACAIDKEEANPYSASRDITPAASTRVSYNWRNNPGSPNSEPLQTTETENMLSIDRLALEPSVIRTTSITSNQGAKCAGIYRVPPPEVPASVSSRHPATAASMVTEEISGAGVYSPRQARMQSTLNQDHPIARTEWDGPAQIRNIPPLDQTALWTPTGAPRVAGSSSSSRSEVPTPRSWAATHRASAPSSSTAPSSSCVAVSTAANHGSFKQLDVAARGRTQRQGQSWEIPVFGDEIMCSDLALQGTQEAENPWGEVMVTDSSRIDSYPQPY